MAEKKESFSELTLIAIEAALAAGEILRNGYGTQFDIQWKKGRHNPVTEYDHKAERAIIDFIRKNAPQSSFLAEESGMTGGKEEPLVWVIDPLDGTVNFAHKIPIFAVSIGVEQHGNMIGGVIYQPMTRELFAAEKDKGAFFNGNRIHASKTKHLKESILATGFPYNLAENPAHCIDHFMDILRAGIPIRRLGAAAINFAYTAAGRFEGFFEISLSSWDCAAGKLLVEEAGGQVTAWDGSPFDIRSKSPVLATNGQIHWETVSLLNRTL